MLIIEKWANLDKRLKPLKTILIFTLMLTTSCSIFSRKNEEASEDALPASEEIMQNDAIQAEIQNLSELPDSMENKDFNFVINEMSYELKKLGAEVKHLNKEIRDIKAQAELWDNPLKIYNKEIILNNGSTVYGKIIFQNKKNIKVETLIGYLILERKDIIRIVENFPDVPAETPSVQARTAPGAATSLNQSVPTATALSSEQIPQNNPNAELKYAANCILMDNIREVTDRSSNKIFSGTIKNIGTRRADFVKINLIFRTNWSGGTKTLTSFVKGSYHTFNSGISSDNTLLPGASGTFSLVIPKSFGTFIGYTYRIDWEEYD